mmetsp:Transcript_19927/g.39904  ORF Transcript_19927/g.39904 Transcript_19927/m.39904 type:complete len:293 (+) Transcript_19927:83-961(+)
MPSTPPSKRQKTSSSNQIIPTHRRRIILLPIAGAGGKLGENTTATLDAFTASHPNVTVVERVQRTYNDDEKTVRKQRKKESDEDYAMVVKEFNDKRATDDALYPKNLTGGNGATAKVVGHATAHLLDACSSHPDADVYFYTSSFGGRLAVHTVLQRSENKKDEANPYKQLEGVVRDVEGNETELKYPVNLPSNFKGVIASGYPLEGKGPLDRRDVLRRLRNDAAAGIKFLFLAGDSDPQSPNLVEDLKEIFGEQTAGVTVVAVAGGKHNVWENAGEEEAERVLGEMTTFLGL